MRPVTICLSIKPYHLDQVERYLRIIHQTMDHFDRGYGPYPYKQITVVDPPHYALSAGGMEYPTLITCGTVWWTPKGWHELEEIAEHEFGHQYWRSEEHTSELQSPM